MKRIVLAVCLLSLAYVNSYAQYNQKSQQEIYAGKVERYKRLSHAGTGMILGGSALTILGMVTVENSHKKRMENNNFPTSDSSNKEALGYYCFGTGIPIAITGIVLQSIWEKKAKFYKSKIELTDLRFKCTPRQTGLSLAFRF
jgi:hypothetical protein